MAPLIPIFAAIGSVASAAAPYVAAGTAIYGAVASKQQSDEAKRKTVAPVGSVKAVEGTLTSQAEKEKERRMRQAQAVMLKDWEAPVLGFPGLLGISGG